MAETVRLVEILREYGEIFEGQTFEEVRPILEKGIWWIPLGDGQALRVAEAGLPSAVQGLLRLYVDAVSQPVQEDQAHWHGVVGRWLAGDEQVDLEELHRSLTALGLADREARVVAIQVGKGGDETLLDEAVQLLQGLLEEQPSVVVRQGERRIYVLLHDPSAPASEMVQAVLAWMDTLGTELYLLGQAGISAAAADWRGLEQARVQAEFALNAGALYRSKDAVYEYERLGLSRVLYGLPVSIRGEFVREVLPEKVAANLTPELRETIFAFFEHGQQVADTARSLYIHRNTLLYRLDRIAELTGYDIRKPMQGWTLWLALTLSRTDSPKAVQ